MCEKVTAELRVDGTIVLTIPDEDSIDIESAFMDGATCSRNYSMDPGLDEESRDMALQAAECLERLEEIFGQAFGENPPKRTRLRSI